MRIQLALVAAAVVVVSCAGKSQNNEELEGTFDYQCIAFYNLENLFDTLIDPDSNKILQDDFTPSGSKKWNTKKYYEKLDNLALVISKLGAEKTENGLAILGVSEIENKSVLIDLVAQEKIKSRNYQIVHYESPDKRGIDVGLLYNPTFFKVLSTSAYNVNNPEDSTWRTRNQLLVTGELNGERIHVMVVHWPSRRGGQKKSAPKRDLAAKVGRTVIDSILKAEPNAKIFYIGDLNDDPKDVSVRKTLGSVGEIDKLEEGNLFNPLESFHEKGIGSLCYNDVWNLFDQIIITQELVKTDYSSYRFSSVVVYNKDYLIQKSGRYVGYPKRTYSMGQYNGGYSDHFPVYLFLIKTK
ncbi:MAG: endonuclease/exonuclease/phosphatase family protein [Flavobacteriales bacterium]|nr:endonuclease/exonuclease/phosphatase family protein [Flavobacteriales bacterium]